MNKFISYFYDNCVSKENFNQICSNDAINNAGFDLNEINQCLYDSFSCTVYEKQNQQYQKIYKNKILDKEYEERKQYLISRVPSMCLTNKKA